MPSCRPAPVEGGERSAIASSAPSRVWALPRQPARCASFSTMKAGSGLPASGRWERTGHALDGARSRPAYLALPVRCGIGGQRLGCQVAEPAGRLVESVERELSTRPDRRSCSTPPDHGLQRHHNFASGPSIHPRWCNPSGGVQSRAHAGISHSLWPHYALDRVRYIQGRISILAGFIVSHATSVRAVAVVPQTERHPRERWPREESGRGGIPRLRRDPHESMAAHRFPAVQRLAHRG